jgi:type IV fimbrial biogenesis protein FimT
MRETPSILSKVRSRDEGFTLIEMAIAVAIAGILVALAVPNFQIMYAKYELYQATTTLYQRMLMARASAIRLNTVVTAVPVILPDGTEQLNLTVPLPPEVLPRRVGFLPAPVPPPGPPGTPIGFNGRGMSTMPLAPGTLQLQSIPFPNIVYTVSVYPTGRVTLCRNNIVPCP